VWALNRALKRHFGIPDNPIRFINRGYESIFKIKANPLSESRVLIPLYEDPSFN